MDEMYDPDLIAQLQRDIPRLLKAGDGSERHTIVLTRAQLRDLMDESGLFSLVYTNQIADQTLRVLMPGAFSPGPDEEYHRELEAALDAAVEQACRCTKCGKGLATLCNSCHLRELMELAQRGTVVRRVSAVDLGGRSSYGLNPQEMG